MANQIQAQFSFTLQNGDHSEHVEVNDFQDSQTGLGAHKPILSIGTVEEVVSFGDVTTPKYLFFRNLDDTNFVQIGPESGGALVPLASPGPGQWGFLPLDPGVILRAKADTAACKVLFLITEA